MGSRPRELAAAFWRRTLLGPRVGSRIVLHEELRSLVGAGISVADAIGETARRAGGARRAALEALGEELARGAKPGEAFLRHPERFAPVEGHLVASGDLTGRYDQAFADAAAHLERLRKDFRRVLQAVLYPLVLLHFALLVPACSLIAARSGSAAAQRAVLLVLLAVWGGVAAVVTLHAAWSRDARWGRFLALLPLLGGAVRDGALARASSAAGTLVGAGASLHDAFAAAGECAGNGWVRDGFLRAAERVQGGALVADAFGSVEACSQEERNLVAAGERSGDLDRMLLRVAEMARDRSEASMKRLAVLLPVVMMALVGLWVASMAIDAFSSAMGGF